ncbi:27-O-demethylrifamycin SV methyltransferase [Sphaerisporangium flaviroseum]|uniref:27-O-demethylrifamycin SV methyltransferase n=1 Tax=Sphaerisporangium flaviroseum TaxID=509199 RepID=A0ABP7HII9_9ACTN
MTTDQASPSSAGTAEYYDISNLILIEVWDENFHQGYWHSEDDESSNRVAAERMTDLLIEKSELGQGGRVLDIGCGIGTSAFRLAEATPAEIVGISNNQAQIDEANRRAAEKGVADRVSFAYADALDLPYADDSFDVVWVFESLMHMNRLLTLREIGRVLRPGGRVVLTDQLRTGPMSEEDDRSVRSFMEQMQASPLLDLDGYRALVAESGLELVELLDISKHTKKTTHRVIAAIDERWDELVARYGEEIAPLLEVFRSPVGLVPQLGYLIAVARKAS